jgi:hypothetical protein
LYKEDFNRFVASLNEVVDHVKTELMPEFDYEEFDRRQAEWEAQNRDSEDDDHESDDSPFKKNDEVSDEFEDDHDDSAEKPSKKEDDDVSW